MDSVFLGLRLTPHGRLVVCLDACAPSLEAKLGARLQKAFERGSGHGLLLLGAEEAGTLLPPVFSYCGEFGAHCVTPSARSLRARQGVQDRSRHLLRMSWSGWHWRPRP